MSEFDADTRVEAAAARQYSASVSDRWHALGSGPNGGYLLALCLQALRREMPLPDPLVVSAFFLRPGRAGPATLHTELVRAGRRTATGQVRMEQDGRETVRVTATFADLDNADGRTLSLDGAPVLPAPQQCVDPLTQGVLPGVSIADRFDYRFPEAPGWSRGEPGNAPAMEFWMRLKDGRDADLLTLPLLVDAAPPAVLDLGVSGSTTLELTVHLRAKPAPGWLACRVVTRHVRDGIHEEDFEVWDSGGTLVAQSRQIALLPPEHAPRGE